MLFCTKKNFYLLRLLNGHLHYSHIFKVFPIVVITLHVIYEIMAATAWVIKPNLPYFVVVVSMNSCVHVICPDSNRMK